MLGSGPSSGCRCLRSFPISNTRCRRLGRVTDVPCNRRTAASCCRIDADYVFPPSLGLPPRTETDSGDVYAPAGTAVTLHVFTDRPVASGQLSLANGQSISLAARADAQLTATLNVLEDGSYRVALRDRDGLADPGQTEYFIRALEDRPPDVHVVKPASDRSVTRLEEVDIEAQAEDDYGIDRMELVYAVRGQSEKIVPLDVPRRGTSVTARHTLYLEDLDVRPGRLRVLLRARTRRDAGTRPNEGRAATSSSSVRPFRAGVALAQSQSMAGSGYNGSIDEPSPARNRSSSRRGSWTGAART